MHEESTHETGWSVVAENDEVATIIDAVIEMDPEESYTRSELADRTGIALKTLHLVDDVERVVELGILEKHDPEGEETTFSVNQDSQVLQEAREFSEAVEAAQE